MGEGRRRKGGGEQGGEEGRRAKGKGVMGIITDIVGELKDSWTGKLKKYQR